MWGDRINLYKTMQVYIEPYKDGSIDSPSTTPTQTLFPHIPNEGVHKIVGDNLVDILISVSDFEVEVKLPQNHYRDPFILYAKVALRLALVCRHWEEILLGPLGNKFWRMITIRFKWTHLKKLKLKVRNWYSFTKSRISIQQAILDGKIEGGVDLSLVENCHKMVVDDDEFEWQLKCPKLFEKMQTTEDENVRFCDGCQQNVYLVKDIEEMNFHTVEGHCVAHKTSLVNVISSKLLDIGLRGIDQIWRSKEEYEESGPSVVGRRCF